MEFVTKLVGGFLILSGLYLLAAVVRQIFYHDVVELLDGEFLSYIAFTYLIMAIFITVLTFIK